MGAISWVCEFMAHWWDVIGKNSGQIQSIVAIVALIVAIVALFKVLKQIDISNDQTKISIEQMDKLNKERVFELRLRLRVEIFNQIVK